MINQLLISQIEIDPELGRTEAEFMLLGTCEDIIQKLRRGRRYDIIRSSGLLRQIFLDREPLLDAANRRFRLKITFNNSRDDSEITKEAMVVLKKYESICWIFPIALIHDKSRPRISKEQFLKLPVLYQSGNPSLTVQDTIETIAHVYGGVHAGKPKSEEDRLIMTLDESMNIGGGEPSMTSIYGICIVALDGLTPLIKNII
ncbi:MAG: hypothetical protein IPF38_06045 [Burkholderiales bacterium]|nr:hypothetical protein [Burkholderiales bacterium]